MSDNLVIYVISTGAILMCVITLFVLLRQLPPTDRLAVIEQAVKDAQLILHELKGFNSATPTPPPTNDTTTK